MSTLTLCFVNILLERGSALQSVTLYVTDWSQHIDCFFHNFGMSVSVADVSIQAMTVNNVSVRYFGK